MQREILIVTTFKEFKGRDGDIQRFWLEHLHEQTYKNFKLIVTNFREKLVRDAVKKSKIAFEFYQSKSDCIFSITEMFENTLKHIKCGKQIILFPSPDHIFEPNFFKTIIDHFEPMSGGTTFPHPQHLSILDFEQNNMYDEYHNKHVKNLFEYDPNKHIPEAFYLDADLLLSKKWSDNFFEEKIEGAFPGITLHLMFLSSAVTLKNLVFKTKVHKIISHVNPETNKLDLINFLSISHQFPDVWKKNEDLLIRFCERQKIKTKFYLGTFLRSRKLVMFSRFKTIGTSSEKIKYFLYLTKFTLFPQNKFILASKLSYLIRLLIGTK